ncbi:hypothetical protein PINS_up002874 [Pythium insidiosum]|nr:hypothetical protein PINS_up002874 [Pythium insidiosum]
MSARDDDGGGGGARVMVDSEIERRIEEKILRRLKKQEENRIAQAIEQRMREEKANWRDDEMNRIIMEMRERFQKELASSALFTNLLQKSGVNTDSQSAEMLKSLQSAAMAMTVAPTMPPSADGGNPQAEEKSAANLSMGPLEAATDGAASGVDAMAMSDPRARSVSKESSWNNACDAFLALRVVVWKHSFLPRMSFERHPTTGIWNAIKEIDGDESFSHVAEGDALISINGRTIDSSVQTEEDLQDVFAAFASPLILKFEAANPHNDKVHDYTVTWSNGPLGVTLKDDASSQKVPIVNRLTKKAGSVAVKQNIAIGDILVAINNIDTIQLGCSLSMSILKKVQLPAKLRFRGVGGPASGSTANDDGEARKDSVNTTSSSMSRPAVYTVNWGEGPLGLTIIPGMETSDLPVIKKVTGTGTSEGIEKAQVGDFLESMNDLSTAGMPFEQVVSYLKSAPKPVLLRFRAAEAEEVAVVAAVAAPAASPQRVIEIARAPSAELKVAPPPRQSPIPSPAPSPPKPVAAPAPPPSPPVIQPDARDNYKIVWGDGPLGLTIDALPGNTGAYIKRIATQGAAARLSQDCIGDLLTHINDLDVGRIAFQDIVSHLKSAPRPVTLFFRRRSGSERRLLSQSSSAVSSSSGSSSSSAAAQRNRHSEAPVQTRRPEENGLQYYNVVWQEGSPLGLSLRGADSTCDYPYITRVTGSGSAAHLPSSVVGDCLVSVDGRSVHVRDKTFDEVMSMLKNMPKPVTLRFQSRAGETQRGGSGGAGHHDPRALQNQTSQAWRQQRGGDMGHPAPSPMPPQQSSSLPTPGSVFASSALRPNGAMSRSFVTQTSERALDVAAGNEEKFSSIQAPFLVQNKLSTGRRQKMLKGLKK